MVPVPTTAILPIVWYNNVSNLVFAFLFYFLRFGDRGNTLFVTLSALCLFYCKLCLVSCLGGKI